MQAEGDSYNLPLHSSNPGPNVPTHHASLGGVASSHRQDPLELFRSKVALEGSALGSKVLRSWQAFCERLDDEGCIKYS